MICFRAIFLAVFTAFLLLSQTVWADDSKWPKVVEETIVDNNLCFEAYSIAKSKYKSNRFYLHSSVVNVSDDINSSLVLHPEGSDISGGDALIEDSKVFQKIPKHSLRSIYWQIGSKQGLRIVVNEEPLGWRGDRYSLFVVSEDVTPEAFLDDLSKSRSEKTYEPTLYESWWPPLILQNNESGELWVIKFSGYQVLGSWEVYSLNSNGMQKICSIRFYPEDAASVVSLPSPINKLAMLLDGALGNPKNEGTLQPTAHLRGRAKYMWGNVLKRPWAALNAKPSNSRIQVDNELEKWSQKTINHARHYQQILKQYPKTEKALAEHYISEFNKTQAEANVMAKEALDIAYRMYFVFPNDRN
jgi:hypothetical protein